MIFRKIQKYTFCVLAFLCLTVNNAKSDDSSYDQDFLSHLIKDQKSVTIIIPFNGSTLLKLSNISNELKVYLQYQVRSIDNVNSIAAIFNTTADVVKAKINDNINSQDTIIMPVLVHYPSKGQRVSDIASIYKINVTQLEELYGVTRGSAVSYPIIIPAIDSAREAFLIQKDPSVVDEDMILRESEEGDSLDKAQLQNSTKETGSSVIDSAAEMDGLKKNQASEIKASEVALSELLILNKPDTKVAAKEISLSQVVVIEKPKEASMKDLSSEPDKITKVSQSKTESVSKLTQKRSANNGAKLKSVYVLPCKNAKFFQKDNKTKDLYVAPKSESSEVIAIGSGKILYAGNKYDDYGYMIIMEISGSKDKVLYSDLASVNVMNGDAVDQGDTIGISGKAGSEFRINIQRDGKFMAPKELISINKL